MLVASTIKITVLNENCERIHIRWTKNSRNQISLDWLIESDVTPQSFCHGSEPPVYEIKKRERGEGSENCVPKFCSANRSFDHANVDLPLGAFPRICSLAPSGRS